jgi:tRNA dimethylallyltransferase
MKQNNPSTPIQVPVLLGPTAAGKTALALDIAEQNGWEIISCDSRQIYRFMDIGTAKPSAKEMELVPHHLIDIINPDVLYSVYAFVKDATEVIRELARKGRVGLVCGGTGLYYEGLRMGIGPQIESDPEVRDLLMSRAARDGSMTLYTELMKKDPESAEGIHSNDVQRIVRALAVFYQTGTKLSALKCLTTPPADMVFKTAVVLPPRELLYERINARVDRMVRQGLRDEFGLLREKGFHDGSPGLQCVGYKELFAVERGESSFKDAVEKIKQNTRRYAKRQITWFGSHNKSEIIEYCDDHAVLKTLIANAIAF